MKLRLVCVGKLSEAFLREGAEEYAGRIQRYLPLEIIELKEEKQGGKKPDPRRIRDLEAERILARIPDGAFVLVLDENGRSLSSEGFSELLGRHMVQGTPELVAVIGGAYGLGERVKQRGDLVLSLSAMTFTHQMARLFLFEQIYRGLTILRNEPYHNR
ncbi:ribosomal RNA large subunit methyltransferase H [Desulfuromonas versatilis]|uniref:Ribosomal RNA large subunit methyltransferase H n=1 Tax=Desulfuromonas versatilis TaxID=2802975 RepID=A0ABM8HSJ9_9BACT|nr:23S rRNA (pseudouridine(1915)-N(3))-methyltransferase RlmH [Desulfuromonas versatilis]BCR03596.1 ribosomal RNA large subunit methyltransferase H [Desulfuromonas versatilis]